MPLLGRGSIAASTECMQEDGIPHAKLHLHALRILIQKLDLLDYGGIALAELIMITT